MPDLVQENTVLLVNTEKNKAAYKDADEIFDILEDTLGVLMCMDDKNIISLKNRIIDVLNDMDRSIIRIKQCPCGGISKFLKAEGKSLCKIVCSKCGRTMDIQDDSIDAIRSWNTAISMEEEKS